VVLAKILRDTVVTGGVEVSWLLSTEVGRFSPEQERRRAARLA